MNYTQKYEYIKDNNVMPILYDMLIDSGYSSKGSAKIMINKYMNGGLKSQEKRSIIERDISKTYRICRIMNAIDGIDFDDTHVLINYELHKRSSIPYSSLIQEVIKNKDLGTGIAFNANGVNSDVVRKLRDERPYEFKLLISKLMCND